MPPLENYRHERFAQGLAKGMTSDAAYVAAGFSENRGNATRLKANESVVSRVAELQERTAIRAEITAESLIAELEDVRNKALAAGQFAPAVSAIKEKAILAGVRIEKRETTNKRDPEKMSDAEILEALRSEMDSGANPAFVGSGKSH